MRFNDDFQDMHSTADSVAHEACCMQQEASLPALLAIAAQRGTAEPF
jgi:hypothetical protein